MVTIEQLENKYKELYNQFLSDSTEHAKNRAEEGGYDYELAMPQVKESAENLAQDRENNILGHKYAEAILAGNEDDVKTLHRYITLLSDKRQEAIWDSAINNATTFCGNHCLPYIKIETDGSMDLGLSDNDTTLFNRVFSSRHNIFNEAIKTTKDKVNKHPKPDKPTFIKDAPNKPSWYEQQSLKIMFDDVSDLTPQQKSEYDEYDRQMSIHVKSTMSIDDSWVDLLTEEEVCEYKTYKESHDEYMNASVTAINILDKQKPIWHKENINLPFDSITDKGQREYYDQDRKRALNDDNMEHRDYRF